MTPAWRPAKVKALGLSKAVCVNHEVGNISLDDRCRGFADGLGAEVPVLQGVMDPTEMKGRIAAHLAANPDTEFVLTVGSAGADPALAAVDEAGLAGKVKTGTFDLSPTILQAVMDGKMEWGIDAQQYLMGYVPVVMFDLMKRYKLAPIEDYPTGPGFVAKAEAAPSSISPSKACAKARAAPGPATPRVGPGAFLLYHSEHDEGPPLMAVSEQRTARRDERVREMASRARPCAGRSWARRRAAS